MIDEVFLAFGLGIVGTYITNIIKRRWPNVTVDTVHFVVLCVCGALALIVTLVRTYAPAEFVSTLGVAFASAIAWYQLAVKTHTQPPQIQ